MKTFLLFLSIVFAHQSFAQVPAAMPPDADAFYKNAMPTINPQLKNVIIKSASILKNQQVNGDSLIKALHSNPSLKGMSDENIVAISTLIMVQASKDADEDLKKMVLSMKGGNETETVSNTKGTDKKESSQGINDRKQLMLQMIMNRKSKMAEEISLVIKEIYGNRENIINNLK